MQQRSATSQVFETESSLAALWTASGTVFLWTEQEDPKELHGAPRHVLAHSGGKFILTNHDLEP